MASKFEPPHGWRSLAWEVGVVVVGVLIALVLSRSRMTSTGKRRFGRKRSTSTSMFAMRGTRRPRVAWRSPGLSRRLADIARVLDRHERGAPLGIIGPIGRATVWSSNQSALSMASSDGTLAHIPVKVRSAYFQVKSQTEEFQRAAWDERVAWRVLNRLNLAAGLDEGGWSDIYAAYQDALDSDRIMRTNLVADYKDGYLSGFNNYPPMPIDRDELNNPLTRSLCKAAVTP